MVFQIDPFQPALMDSLFATTAVPYPVDNIASAPKYSQLWEVVLVAASPVVLVFCLCFCIVCLVFRKQEPVEATVTQSSTQPTSRRNAIVNLLRSLPPPPKYDIAVSSSSAPPHYAEAEKNIIFDPVAAITAARRAASQGHGTACSLSIQYLYPPKYETQSRPAARASPPSPPAYSVSTVTELEEEELPTYAEASSTPAVLAVVS